ncbi:MAG: hypothetical protein NT013_08905 [Planctomycetia bacterium]|nr:hypothetical protein [Planctomycetia bacterium]
MACFSEYENYPCPPKLLQDEMVEFAIWLLKRKQIAEEHSQYNVSDFSAIECAAVWEHIKAGRVTYWTDYGSDPYGIEEFVEFVGFKGSNELGEWLKEQTLRESTAPANTDNEQPQDVWSVAKPPADWRKELGLSETTMRSYIKKGLLIVKKLTTKRWQFRLDTLQRYQNK